MIDRKHKLSITLHAKALEISRGSVYYRPRPVSDADLILMRQIDELHLDYPFAGSRMLKGLLVGEGYGDTPEPFTPYQKASHVWDARMGDALVRAKNWRLCHGPCCQHAQ